MVGADEGYLLRGPWARRGSVPLSVMWGPRPPAVHDGAPRATRMTTNRETRVPVIPLVRC